jgi:hypothetical protein
MADSPKRDWLFVGGRDWCENAGQPPEDLDMRKITALAALLIAAFSLAACKNSNDEEYQHPRSGDTPAIYNELPPQGSIGSS